MPRGRRSDGHGYRPRSASSRARLLGRLVRPARARRGVDSAAGDDAAEGAVTALFRRDSLYMLLWAVQLGLAALVTPVVTRVMGAGEFGAVAAANAAMQVLYVLCGMGLSVAIQRRYPEPGGPADARRLLLLATVASLALTVAVDGTGRWWSSPLGFSAYGGAVRLAVWWAGISAMTNAGLAYLRSQDRLGPFAVVSLVQSVVAEVTSLVLVVTIDATAQMFVLGQLLAQVAATVIVLAMVPPLPLRTGDRALVVDSLRFSLPLVPSMLSAFVLSASDRFVVQEMLGQTSLARYQVAYNVGSIPILLVSVLSSAWLPRLFALGSGETRSLVLARSRDALYRLTIPVVVGLLLGCPLVLRVWAPASYDVDSLVPLTSVVIVAVLPFTAGLASSRGLMAEGRSVAIALANLVAAVVNVVLNLVMVPHWGLTGAAVATFLSYGLLHQLLRRPARVTSGMAPTSRRLSVLLVVTCVAGVALSAVPPGGAWLWVRTILAAGCLVWFLTVLRDVRRAPD